VAGKKEKIKKIAPEINVAWLHLKENKDAQFIV